MARNEGAVAEPETVTNEDGTVTTVATTSKRKTPGVMVGLPVELIALIKARGETENKPNSRVIAELTAREFGYELPAMERSRRTADNTGISASAKNAAVAKLIELAEAGQIELGDDLKALLNLNKQ